MLQANPALTPNAVKAILQFTAEHRDGYDDLTQGAGFLNARGAVELARRSPPARPRRASPTRSGALEPAHHLGQSPHRRVDDARRRGERRGRTDVDLGRQQRPAAPDDADGGVTTSSGAPGAAQPALDDSRGRLARRRSAQVAADIVWGTSGEDDDIVWRRRPTSPTTSLVEPARDRRRNTREPHDRGRARWNRRHEVAAARRAALRLRDHRAGRRPARRVLSVEIVRQPVALPAAAAALVDHLGLQGEPAARAQRSRRCRSRTRSTSPRCCCSGRTRR